MYELTFRVGSRSQFTKSVARLRHKLMLQGGDREFVLRFTDGAPDDAGARTMFALIRAEDGYLVGVRKTAGKPWRICDAKAQAEGRVMIQGANENYNRMGAVGVTMNHELVQRILDLDWDSASWSEMTRPLVLLIVATVEAARSVPVRHYVGMVFNRWGTGSVAFTTVEPYVKNWDKATGGNKFRFGSAGWNDYHFLG